MDKCEIAYYGILAAVVLAVGSMFYNVIRNTPNNADIEAVKVKYGCVATNEFVGKDGDRLYLCQDGLKYKDSVFFGLAYDENKKK